MNKLFILSILFLSEFITYGQTTLKDPNIKATIQKIKDNADHLLEAFKGAKEPDLGLGLQPSYSTKIKLYNVKGSMDDNDFDENMSFRISNSDYKKATKADFDKAFAEMSEALKSSFSDLEIREKQDDKSKELTLFEKGKDTNAPMANENSPKYYITLKYTEETTGFYALFFFITSKKKK
jgi:hypothetical protein